MPEPAAENPESPLQRGVAPTLLWACFLGCSWTWIIGMVFPVLLLRDYGPWGWVVFAVPNVLGAAAMGTVLWKPQWSTRVVAKHRDMGLRFSEVTISYHGFVLGWLLMRQFGFSIALAAVGATFIMWSRVRGDRAAGITAAIVAAASALWLGYGCFVAPDDTWVGVFRETAVITPRLDLIDLILFAPAAVMGFLCCPYLDLTFHRARIATAPLTGAAAFAIGFGVVFLAMIVGSLMYAGLLLPALSKQPFALPATWNIVLAVHITLQLAFTVAVHTNEVSQRGGAGAMARLVLLAALATGVGWWVGQPDTGGDALSAYSEQLSRLAQTPATETDAAPDAPPAAPPLTSGETIYRLFLLCYGMVFPAYVWLCMIPTLRPTNPRTRKAIFILGAVVCFPMGWAFFVGGGSAWIIAIIAVLAALRIIVETTPRYIEAPVQSPPQPNE